MYPKHPFLTLTGLLFFSFFIAAESTPDSIPSFENKEDVFRVGWLSDSLDYSFIDTEKVYDERWDLLAQPQFWKKVMTLSTDSCVINIAKTREIVVQMSVEKWDQKSDKQKDNYRDSVRKSRELSENDKVYMTTGKADYYAFDKVIPSISKGIEVFQKQGVDPFYAQAILMIESPGKLEKSNAGAYGPFQLMTSVARTHGLRVDRYVDERKDFTKSAEAASSLIAKTCIPEANKLLQKHSIVFHEKELWYRLFVLHIYHAGAANVASVMNVINPNQGGMGLIQKMWRTSAGRFRNASQNYSQLAIAAMLILDELIWLNCENEEEV